MTWYEDKGAVIESKRLNIYLGLIIIAILLFGTLSGYIIDLQWFKELDIRRYFLRKYLPN